MNDQETGRKSEACNGRHAQVPFGNRKCRDGDTTPGNGSLRSRERAEGYETDRCPNVFPTLRRWTGGLSGPECTPVQAGRMAKARRRSPWKAEMTRWTSQSNRPSGKLDRDDHPAKPEPQGTGGAKDIAADRAASAARPPGDRGSGRLARSWTRMSRFAALAGADRTCRRQQANAAPGGVTLETRRQGLAATPAPFPMG